MSKKQTKDLLYALTKAGLASIPIAGAAASELLQLIIASPLEKRRTKWLTDIGEKLTHIAHQIVETQKKQHNFYVSQQFLHFHRKLYA